MSNVETRAHVTSLSAFAPTCDDAAVSPGLSAQRTYRSSYGVEAAIETALTDNGWRTTRTPDGYQAHLKSGRFTTQVELTVSTGETVNSDDGNGSFITALYSFD